MKEKKDRVEDALNATRAAVEEGIVPGGGVAFIRAIAAVNKYGGADPEEQAGVNIVKRALEEPLQGNSIERRMGRFHSGREGN